MALELKVLGTLLAKDLNSIADLPDYKTPPFGKYILKIEKVEEKEVNESPAIIVTYAIVSTIELGDPETAAEDLVKEGDLFSEMFMFSDPKNFELTLGAMKKKFAGLAEYAQSTQLDVILANMIGAIIKATVTNRLDKKSMPPKIYPGTKDISLATA